MRDAHSYKSHFKPGRITTHFNPFIPEFLKWTLPSLNLDISTAAKNGFHSKFKNRMANRMAQVFVLVYRAERVNQLSVSLYS